MIRHASVVLCLLAGAALVPAQEKADRKPLERGLVTHQPGLAPGYTLISPFALKETYLLDSEARIVHRWQTRYEPGLFPYLLPNGNLLRGIQLNVPVPFAGGGQSGGVQEFTWDGELVWEYHLANDLAMHHHDIEPLPNGNLLMVAWEARSKEEALAAGRLPDWIGEGGLWPTLILEVEPQRPFGAQVVWEWHMWDHLIQDVDSDLPDHGPVFENPQRLNVNGDVPRAEDDPTLSAEAREQMQALGYVAGDSEDLTDDQRRRRERNDWLHVNGIDYNAELDQILFSSHAFSEIFIIDHSTTTEEARGSTGGRSGRGGDILYRWGNPQNWQQGTAEDRQLFRQHDPQWVPKGFPGEGNITVFNNGADRPGEEYSTVLEIVPPLNAQGTYDRDEGMAFGPAEPVWTFDPQGDERFFASFISGAHRLQNGNTLVCSGPQGRAMEVSPAGEILWDYRQPYAPIRGEEELSDGMFSMFRALRVPPDHPALVGRVLEPLAEQPKTAGELLVDRGEIKERSRNGWRDLLDPRRGLSDWVNVNCAEGSTFQFGPNPDDRNEPILLCSGKPTGILRSAKMYENFVVEFEWRHMDENGNAGFFLWADPVPAVGGPFTRGIEVQVCNLGNGSWFTSHGDIFPIWGAAMTPDPRFRISGSRSMPKEDDFRANPTGEWNHYRITALDGAVTLEVNGEVVTAGSRCSPYKGYLCLESEGGEVHFRGMQIWELPAGSHPAEGEAVAREAQHHRTLYSGLSLAGLEVVSGAWTSHDWRLACQSGEASMQVPVPEGADHLFFDFKRAAAPASGFLPVAFGESRVPAAGEQVGQWNRVTVWFRDQETVVEFGGRTQVLAKETAGHRGTLTLVNDQVATEFCSLMANVVPPATDDD